MSTTSRRRALRTAAVLALAIASVAGVGRMAFSDDAGIKPAPPTLAEGQPVPDPPPFPGEQLTSAPEPFTVPARSFEPTGTCPGGWSWFDNPVMHAGMCVPAGWGFSDFTSPMPMTQIPGEQLTSLHLLSAGAFPWTPGDLPFDAIRARGLVDVEMTLLEPSMVASTECEPSVPRMVNDRRLLTCTQSYDHLGSPASTGDLHAIKVAVPLLTTPTPVHPAAGLSGARLLLIARYADTTPSEEVDLLWKLVDSIEVF